VGDGQFVVAGVVGVDEGEEAERRLRRRQMGRRFAVRVKKIGDRRPAGEIRTFDLGSTNRVFDRCAEATGSSFETFYLRIIRLRVFWSKNIWPTGI